MIRVPIRSIITRNWRFVFPSIELGRSTMNATQARTRSKYIATSNVALFGPPRARGLAIAIGILILAGNLAATAVRADDTALGEIVVTAQRRQENLQDVPTAITVFTPQQLTQLRIEQTEDLAQYTPGLTASTSQFGDPVFSLRGVGMNNA